MKTKPKKTIKVWGIIDDGELLNYYNSSQSLFQYRLYKTKYSAEVVAMKLSPGSRIEILPVTIIY